jgi:hypothetical protein
MMKIEDDQALMGSNHLCDRAQRNFQGLEDIIVPELPIIWQCVNDKHVSGEPWATGDYPLLQEAALRSAQEMGSAV